MEPDQQRHPLNAAAKKLAKQFPDLPTRTLAKRLAKEQKTTIEKARSALRYVRGNVGSSRRDKSTIPRPNQPAGWVPQMPPSLAEPWTPFDLGNGLEVGVISDLHVPYHSDMAVGASVKELKRRKLNTLLINGDCADFYSISRHQKDPSKRDLENEITLVRECLRWLRSEFPKVRIVFKLGNHEERWQHWLWNSLPELSSSSRMDVKEWLECEQTGIEVVGDQRPIMLGNLPVLHGHELGRGGFAAPVNPSRGAFLRTHSTILVSHSHTTSQHSESNLWHVPTVCWSVGALCDLTPEYARINRWNYGFATVSVDNASEFAVENLRIGLEGQIYR